MKYWMTDLTPEEYKQDVKTYIEERTKTPVDNSFVGIMESIELSFEQKMEAIDLLFEQSKKAIDKDYYSRCRAKRYKDMGRG